MEREHDIQEGPHDHGNYQTSATVSRYDRIGSRIADRFYPGICGRKTWKSNAPCKCERSSSIDYLESYTKCGSITRNRSDSSACRDNTKNLSFRYLILDNYLNIRYIHSRRIPGMESTQAAIIPILGLEHDIQEGNTNRSGNRTPSPKYGHRGVGSRVAHSVYPRVCGCETWEPKTFSRSQFHSSEQNIEPNTWPQFFSRNGFDHNTCRDNTKNPVNGFYLLDLYPLSGYIISHNTPTKNEKARLQPGSRINRSLTPNSVYLPFHLRSTKN